MLIPDNQRTSEYIKKSIYDSIRNTFSNYATYWNAIWKVWQDNSPPWDGRWVPGNADPKIQMHDSIPVELRYTKTKSYEGLAGEINPTISVESSRVHTLGNENNIRTSLHTFNKTLAEKFGEREYNSTSQDIYRYRVMSYGVTYQTYNLVGDLQSEEKYYTTEYERFDDNYNVKLYRDTTCNSLVKTVPVSLWQNEQHFVVKWNGDRYYQRVNYSTFQTGAEKSYSCPALTSNNSNGVSVSCSHRTDVWKIFNGVSRELNFGKNISSSNPCIIYFAIDKPLRLTSYTISSDNRPSGVEHPIDWTMEGSNDNRTWSRFDTRTGESFKQNETRIFSCNSGSSYNYFRWRITNYNKKTSGDGMELRRFTFSGMISTATVNSSAIQPDEIGQSSSTSVSSYGVRTDSSIESSSNNWDKFIAPHYRDNDAKIEDNQEVIYAYNNSSNWQINNIENNVRQDNLIRKEDYQQLNRLLDKIGQILKLRDSWFDSNGRCAYSCQVACQNRCQLSCQACNTKQCHNQKCGTH